MKNREVVDLVLVVVFAVIIGFVVHCLSPEQDPGVAAGIGWGSARLYDWIKGR